MFQGRELKLNMHSKIIDYAGGKYRIDSLKEDGKTAEFYIEKRFIDGIRKFSKEYDIKDFVLITPTEPYVYENFKKIKNELHKDDITLSFTNDTQSRIISHEEFKKQYNKPPVMEFFYRFMRKKFDIMVDSDNEPEGGEWNYDSENRKFDKDHTKSWDFNLPKNTHWKEAEKYYDFEAKFVYPTTDSEAKKLLQYFIEHHLDCFGRLEDAMYSDDPYVHHSLLGTSLNYGFLTPMEVIREVAKQDTALNNKEGFIRQVLGWREYMYHFFHFYKDSIYEKNHFEHTRELPEYFWKDAENCDMKCLSTSLMQVQKENVTHHIQRLMIIGNFTLLYNGDPHELNRWFFEYYADAFEWVVTPNVLAMSQFADGGKLATKPYVASANYINKMSDYCKNCKYDHKEKYTENACPYNYLYWNFVHDNKDTFKAGRQQFVVNNLKKIDIEKVKEQKKKFVEKTKSL